MSKESQNIAVFGSGPSALSAADNLSRLGANVTLITSEASNPDRRSVFSTTIGYPGLAVSEFCPEEFRKNVRRIRVITTQGTDFSGNLGLGYFMVDYPGVINYTLGRLVGNVHFENLPRDEFKSAQVSENNGVVEVLIDGGKQEFDFVVDGTGVKARLSRQADPQRKRENPLVQYVFGGWFPGRLREEELILVADPAGGTSWVNNSVYRDEFGKEGVDIVFSAWGWESDFQRFLSEAKKRLNVLASFCVGRKGIDIESLDPASTFSGMIRAQPLKRVNSNCVYPVGEAASLAKPGFGESFNRALASGQLTAKAIFDKLPPSEVYQLFQKVLRSGDNLSYGITLSRLEYQKAGDLGRVIDMVGNILSRSNNGVVNQSTMNIIEQYVIHGRIHPNLLLNLFIHSEKFREFFIKTLITHLKLSFNNDNSIKPKWVLPEI